MYVSLSHEHISKLTKMSVAQCLDTVKPTFTAGDVLKKVDLGLACVMRHAEQCVLRRNSQTGVPVVEHGAVLGRGGVGGGRGVEHMYE